MGGNSRDNRSAAKLIDQWEVKARARARLPSVLLRGPSRSRGVTNNVLSKKEQQSYSLLQLPRKQYGVLC